MQNLCGKTTEEITEMLSTIREICLANTCESCPFTDGGYHCSITGYTPDKWDLHSETAYWRAFD